MRNIIYLVNLLLVVVTHSLIAQEARMEVKAERNSDNSVTLNFTKNDPGTMTVQTNFKSLENSSLNGASFQAKGYAGQLMTLRPTNKDQRISYSYSYRYIRGKLKPKVAFEFIYGFPHHEGTEARVSEASYLKAKYFGNTEPEDWKSYYIHTKDEAAVLSIRKGLVVEVIDGNEDFTEGITFKSNNNKIIIEHEDGTLATYGALKNGSIKVKVGDVVFPKVELALNSNRGNNQYSFALSIMYLKAADLFMNEGKNISNDKSLYGFVTPIFSVSLGQQVLDNNKIYQAAWSEDLIVKEMNKKELKQYKND